jgi:glutamate formiminotransferase / formiminotetrahydrofolate cyclodeaminase
VRSLIMNAYTKQKNQVACGDKTFVTDIIAKGKEIENKPIALETEILKVVN